MYAERRMLDDLRASWKPERAADLLRYLTELIEPRLLSAGYKVQIVENPDPSGGTPASVD